MQKETNRPAAAPKKTSFLSLEMRTFLSFDSSCWVVRLSPFASRVPVSEDDEVVEVVFESAAGVDSFTKDSSKPVRIPMTSAASRASRKAMKKMTGANLLSRRKMRVSLRIIWQRQPLDTNTPFPAGILRFEWEREWTERERRKKERRSLLKRVKEVVVAGSDFWSYRNLDSNSYLWSNIHLRTKWLSQV